MENFLVEVSGRHCHLTREHVDKLFGKGYRLKVMKKLSQPGEFAAKESVTLLTKKKGTCKLRIIGPVRAHTQVEVSMTDAYALKIKPPIRISGDIKKSAGGMIIGPEGSVKIKEGVIIAKRHFHCDLITAKKLKLRNNQKVSILTAGDRSTVLNEAIVRVKANFIPAFHIDTDEGNASLASGVCSRARLIKDTACLIKKKR